MQGYVAHNGKNRVLQTLLLHNKLSQDFMDLNNSSLIMLLDSESQELRLGIAKMV